MRAEEFRAPPNPSKTAEYLLFHALQSDDIKILDSSGLKKMWQKP